MLLIILELSLGIVWGISLSLFIPSLIESDVVDSYGYLAFLSSISTIASYLAVGRLMDKGYRFPALSIALLGLAVVAMENSQMILATILFGIYIGAHYVTLVYIASDKTKNLLLAHSSNLLGSAIGSILVFLHLYHPALLLLSLAGLGYYGIAKTTKLEKCHNPMKARDVCLILSILGFALGLSSLNVDYYLAMKFKDEKAIAFMFSLASLFSSIAILLSTPLLSRMGTVKLHVIATIVQALIYGSLAIAPVLMIAILLVALGDMALILADSALENIYARREEQRGTMIALAGISWEISAGFGRLLGVSLFSIAQEAPFILSASILIFYTAFWISKSLNLGFCRDVLFNRFD
ncbi:MAG: hypothetical protein QXW74_02955 [Archaeoglobaceae archaeon]